MSAATEATLEELLYVARSQNTNLNNIQRLLSGSGGGGGGTAGVGNASRDAERNIRSMSAASAAASAALGALKLASNLVGGIIGTVVDVFKSLVGGITKTIQNLVSFGQAAMMGTARLSDFYSALGDLPFFMGTIFRMYSDIIRVREATLDAFRQISTSGATFGGSLTEFRNTAFRARLTMQEFTEAVRGSAEALAPIGTQEGARRFGSIVAQLTSGAMGNALFGLGYTAKQIADGTGTFITTIGGMNRARSMSDAQLAAGAGELLLQMDLMAKMTGRSREELEKQIKDKQFEGAFEYFTKTLPPELKGQMQLMITELEKVSPGLAQGLKQSLMTGGGPFIPINDAMRDAVIAVGPDFQNILDQFRQAVLNPNAVAAQQQFQIAQLRASRGVSRTADMMGQAGGYLATQLPFMVSNNQLLAQATRNRGRSEQDLVNTVITAAKDQKTAAKGSAAAATQAELSIRQFGQGIFAMFEKFITPIAQQLEAVLKKFVEFLLPTVKKLIDWFMNSLTYISKAPNIEEGLKRFFEKMSQGLGNAWDALQPAWIRVIKPAMEKVFTEFSNFMRPYLIKMLDGILDALNAWAFSIIGPRFGVVNPELRKSRRDVEYQEMELDRLQRLYNSYVGAIGVNAAETRDVQNQILAGRSQLEQLRKIHQSMYEKYGQTDKPNPFINKDNPFSTRHSGTIGMTGTWWEKESKTLNVQAGETVATQDQIKQIVDYASQNGGNNELSRLNTLMAQLIRETQRVADNTGRTLQATKELNGNLYAA